MDNSNIPTPEELNEARAACGPTAPISILAGWVMGQRRAAFTQEIKETLEQQGAS